MKILHGFTGSVASILLKKFKKTYEEAGHEVNYMFTNSANYFTLGHTANVFGPTAQNLWDDKMEWEYYTKHNKVLHIDLVKDSDRLVIAPLSANTLAKIANGICDNLLTCVARAWDFDKPFTVAPAMNTKMWNHPITKEHIAKIKSWGIKVIDPISKELFCGDVGIGAMADISTIFESFRRKKVKCPYCIDGYQWVGDPCYGSEELVPCFNCKNV